MDCRMPAFPVHHKLPELTQIYIYWVDDAIQTSHPLLFPSSPTFNLSQHQGLFQESVLPIRWPKYWSFSFNISPSNEYSGLISFRIDWLDLLAVQEILKSLLQHHSWKAVILWCTTFVIDGETVGTLSEFNLGTPKSLQMVIAAMKLKDAYSLKGKLWPT